MLPTKQIRVTTTNTHLSGSLPSLLASSICWVFTVLKLFLHQILELQWGTTLSVVTGCTDKALERMLGASSGEARVEGGSGCPVLSTPCQRFALLPGSALQTPGLPAWAASTCQGCACSSSHSSRPHCSLSSFPCSHTTFERTKLWVGYLS